MTCISKVLFKEDVNMESLLVFSHEPLPCMGEKEA